jgi:hypothetical protein
MKTTALAQMEMESFLRGFSIFSELKRATRGSSFFVQEKKRRPKKLEMNSWNSS